MPRKNLPLKIPKIVLQIAKTLHEAGFEPFLVGGAVRDLALGQRPKDWDIASRGTPQQLQDLFKHRCLMTGEKYGTVTLITGDREIKTLEHTTFRSESAYENHRKPQSVQFETDLIKDLSRRDFTINAMAINLITFDSVDPFCGLQALKQKQIKCVGDPNVRFEEDALRILRAFRFAAQCQFKIDPAVLKAARKHKEKLTLISHERIGNELLKLLNSKTPSWGLAPMQACGVSKKVGVAALQAKTIDALHGVAFKCAVGLMKNKNAKTLLKSWNMEKEIRLDIEALLNLKKSKQFSPRSLERFNQSHLGDFKIFSKSVGLHLLKLKPYLLSPIKRVKDLNVNGDDLMKQLGLKGKAIGVCLEHLLNLVVHKKLQNTRPILIKYLKSKQK